MAKGDNPYNTIRNHLSQIYQFMLEAKHDPIKKSLMLQLLGRIEESASKAGGKIEADVNRLVKHIHLFFKEKSNPIILKQILEDILRIREDSSEI